MKTKLLLLSLLFFQTYAFAQLQSNPVSNSSQAGLNEAEAHIAINPSDSNQMAVGFMSQSATSGLGFKIYYSTDAGNSWSLSSFDAATLSNPLYPGSIIAGGGDILLAYDQTGKLYTSWIYLYYNFNTDTAYFSGMWASSSNNGQSFQFENVNQSDEFFGRGILTNGLSSISNLYEGICDRQWMAVDHTEGNNANNLYVGFVNYTNTFAGLKVRSKKSTNSFFDNPVNAAVGSYQLSNLAVDNDGELHYSFARIDGNDGIYHVSSNDGGQTFSALNLVSSAQGAFPQNHQINDRVNAAPSLAIDGKNNLHVTWTSYPNSQDAQSFYSYSTDGGLSWSTPFNMSTALNLNSFYSNVTAHGDKVSISTYGIDNARQADYYLFLSTNNGASFGTPIKLTSQQSNLAGFANTDFAGDYTSSVRSECKTFSVWSDFRNAGQPKLYLSSYSDCAPLGFQEITTINSPFQIIRLYPNPAQQELRISIFSENALKISATIYSIDGKVITTNNQKVRQGKQEFMIPVSTLSRGNYTLVLQDDDGNKITRLFSK